MAKKKKEGLIGGFFKHGSDEPVEAPIQESQSLKPLEHDLGQASSDKHQHKKFDKFKKENN